MLIATHLVGNALFLSILRETSFELDTGTAIHGKSTALQWARLTTNTIIGEESRTKEIASTGRQEQTKRQKRKANNGILKGIGTTTMD